MKDNERDLDIGEFFRVLVSGYKVIALFMFGGVVTLVVISALMTPIYRATAVVLDVSDGARSFGGGGAALLGQLGGLPGLELGELLGGSGPQNRGITFLRSRTFAERFVDAQGLMSEIYPGFDPNAQDPPTLSEAANRFRQDIVSVRPDPSRVGLINIRVEWHDPDVAAEWANQFVSLANRFARERDIRDAEQRLEYLKQQLETTGVVEHRRALFNLVEAEEQTLMLASVRDEYAFEVVDLAIAPRNPFLPNFLLAIIAGLGGGLILGLFAVLLKSTLREAFRAK